MSQAGDLPATRWAERARRIAAAPHTPAVAAAVLGLLAVAESTARAVVAGATPWFGLVLALLALCTTLPLASARPAGAATAIAAASVLSMTVFHTITAAGVVALLVGLYRLGRSGGQLLAVGLALPFVLIALSGAATLSASTVLVPDSQQHLSYNLGAGLSLELGRRVAAVVTVLLAAAAPAAALAGAARRARSEAVRQRAATEVIAGNLLEHTARGERARIARELHDVVAHHISMVAVQAESARLTTPGMPAAGAQRLSAIGDTARAALTEMRRLLGVLREDARAEVADRRPQPGLAQLNDLLDAARDASGSAARLILRGTPIALDPGVELAAYRIAQEALTNARRHAPGSAVDVDVWFKDDGLRLRVRDLGPGPPATSSADGHGLLGMRERAVAVGGQLQTGAAPGGGFVVQATLPAKSETGG